MNAFYSLSPAERDAMKRDFFSSLHCALPGNIVSFDADKADGGDPAGGEGGFPQLSDPVGRAGVHAGAF